VDFLHRALDDALLPGQSYLTAATAPVRACDAHVLPAVRRDSKPLDHRRPAYVVPAHLRVALVGIAVVPPACARPASVCDSHHVVSWLHLEPTALANLVLLCECTIGSFIEARGNDTSQHTAWFTHQPMWIPQRKPNETPTPHHLKPAHPVPSPEMARGQARASARPTLAAWFPSSVGLAKLKHSVKGIDIGIAPKPATHQNHTVPHQLEANGCSYSPLLSAVVAMRRW